MNSQYSLLGLILLQVVLGAGYGVQDDHEDTDTRNQDKVVFPDETDSGEVTLSLSFQENLNVLRTRVKGLNEPKNAQQMEIQTGTVNSFIIHVQNRQYCTHSRNSCAEHVRKY